MPSPFSARAFFGDPLGYVARHANGRGPLRLAAGPRRFLLVRDPNAVWDVLVTDAAAYRQGKWKRRARRFVGPTLNTLSGEEHRRRRLLVQPALDRRRVARFKPALTVRAEHLAGSWRDGARVDLRGALDPLSLAMAGDVLLGVDLGPDADAFAGSLGEVMAALPRLTPPVPGTRGARALGAVHARIDALVAARRADGRGTGDLIDVLLVGAPPDEAIRGEVLAFLLAAVDEPPSGLAAAVFLLGRDPDAEARLHRELDAGGEATPYLDAVLREALRLYPPARYLDRCPMHDVEIGGTAVAAGTDVLLSPLVTHRDPALYERPEAFEPERWLEASAAAARPRGASIPFGAGVHSCIGEPLARLIMGVTLAAIVRRWRLRLDADAPEPVPRAPRLVVTVERR